MDFTGEIEELGVDVDPFRGLKPGVNVFGSIPVSDHLRGHGALSDYVIVDSGNVCIIAKGVEMSEPAGLPIAGCTASGLTEKVELRQGQKILINGAAGGIGSLMTQMIRNAIGEVGRVVAVCSGEKKTSSEIPVQKR